MNQSPADLLERELFGEARLERTDYRELPDEPGGCHATVAPSPAEERSRLPAA